MLGGGILRYALSWVGIGKNETAKKAEIRRQYALLANATTYEGWLAAAERLDDLEGVWQWKKDPSSPYYDSRLIQERLAEMKRLQAEGDIGSMVFMLRTGLQRNLGGIGNYMLHDHSHVGTKILIEEHQKELIRMLLRVCNCSDAELSLEKKLAFFTESRHGLGKTALLLSGGASLGMYHFGVLKALYRHDLLPRIISGSSAGAIVAGIIAVRTNQELERLFHGDIEDIKSTIRLEFFDPIGSLERKLRRILKTGHLMDVKKLQKALIDNMGDITFHEAYERTGRIVNITVSPGNDYEKPRLLNYLTAPNVLIWSAASASCALPGLYEAVELQAKNAQGQRVLYHMSNVKWTDGSLQSDLPMNRLQELFNVNYFIVSQTNPHAIPFVQKAQRQVVRRQAGGAGRGVINRVAAAVGYMLKSEVLHRCQQAINLGLAPKLLALLLNQKYVGDVTIVPPLSIRGYTRIISNPTPDNLAEFILKGERQTWPNIGIIRSQCEVEIVLDQCVRQLATEAQARAVAAQLGANGRCPKDSAAGTGLATGARRLQRTDRAFSALGERRHTHLDLNQFFGGESSPIPDDSYSLSSGSFGSFISDQGLPDPDEEEHQGDGLAVNPSSSSLQACSSHSSAHAMQDEASAALACGANAPPLLDSAETSAAGSHDEEAAEAVAAAIAAMARRGSGHRADVDCGSDGGRSAAATPQLQLPAPAGAPPSLAGNHVVVTSIVAAGAPLVTVLAPGGGGVAATDGKYVAPNPC